MKGQRFASPCVLPSNLGRITVEVFAKGRLMNGIEQNKFGLLDEPKSRWKRFGASFSVQGLLLLFVLVGSVVNAPVQLSRKDFTFITLTAPNIAKPVEPEPERPQVAKIRKAMPAVVEPKLIAPVVARIPKRTQEIVSAPKVSAPIPEFAAVRDVPLPKAPRVVLTNTFGSSATPTLPANTPVSKVQTGGFGDPNGLKPDPNARVGKLVAAATGSFDLPTGRGQGNGTGGAIGAPGVVASAGFGNGVAIHGNTVPRAQIQQVGFADARQATSETPKARLIQTAAETTPVSILSKPMPQYTDEARKEKIEGEVLLRVVFSANGRLEVKSILKGLGHGLDEAAVRAAQQIRYTPAKRDGQAVDSEAKLHIVFQLT
jgi:TonB family protein